jgi:hypothetical protein
MQVKFDSGSSRVEGGQGDMESDARYYQRRAIVERMAAQRAVTETARAWHSKLAAEYSERATGSPAQITA